MPTLLAISLIPQQQCRTRLHYAPVGQGCTENLQGKISTVRLQDRVALQPCRKRVQQAPVGQGLLQVPAGHIILLKARNSCTKHAGRSSSPLPQELLVLLFDAVAQLVGHVASRHVRLGDPKQLLPLRIAPCGRAWPASPSLGCSGSLLSPRSWWIRPAAQSTESGVSSAARTMAAGWTSAAAAGAAAVRATRAIGEGLLLPVPVQGVLLSR